MGESVSFKAYLKRNGQDVEVRRFGIDNGAASNFMYLRSKIQAMFPSIQNDHFSVFWQDVDKDYIAIGSDDELVEALSSGFLSGPGANQPIKLFVHINADQQTDHGPTGVSGQLPVHSGVCCDSCNQEVVGFRYKCVTCPDFDLCASCEAAGSHPEHFMLRMPSPLGVSGHPKFLHKFLTRPHKFHKFAKHYAQYSGFKGGKCPFTRTDSRATPAPGVSDMFDFSALMDFINSITCADNNPPANNAPVNSPVRNGPVNVPVNAPVNNEPVNNTTASASTSGSAPGPQAGAQESRPQNGADYLNGIGQAITAFLDPFDLPAKMKNKISRKITKKITYKGNVHGFKPRRGRFCHKHHSRTLPCHKNGHEPHGQRPKMYGPLHHLAHGHGPHGHRPIGPRHHGPHGHRPNGHGPHGHRPLTLFSGAFAFEEVDLTGQDFIEETIDNSGIDVTFDVRAPTPAAPQQTAPSNSPQQNAAAAASARAASSVPSTPQPTHVATPQQSAPSTPSVSRESTPTADKQPSPVLDTTPLVARRNSDDWTVISRESPARSDEVAMDVDESGAAKSSGAAVVNVAPSAPPAAQATAPSTSQTTLPQPSTSLSDPDRQKIQEAINNIRSMGFNYDTKVLRELLRQENGDIASVLETILNNTGKN